MKKITEPLPNYSMFSVDGNEAVYNLLTHLQMQFWEGIKTIKTQHPEVMHPETTEKIYNAIKHFYHTNPMDLTTLKKGSKIGDYVHYKEELKGILHDVSEDGTQATLMLLGGELKKVKI